MSSDIDKVFAGSIPRRMRTTSPDSVTGTVVTNPGSTPAGSGGAGSVGAGGRTDSRTRVLVADRPSRTASGWASKVITAGRA